MPFAINEDAAKQQTFLNVMMPQEVAHQKPDGTWQATLGGGLPVKQIPHLEYPKVVYMHPNEPFQEIEHRNDRFEVVSTDYVPTEHLTKAVQNESELKAALAAGWVTEPYIPQAAPTKHDSLYGPKKKTRAA